jgi:hypothetical protein
MPAARLTKAANLIKQSVPVPHSPAIRKFKPGDALVLIAALSAQLLIRVQNLAQSVSGRGSTTHAGDRNT